MICLLLRLKKYSYCLQKHRYLIIYIQITFIALSMKKIFLMCISLLILISISFSPVLAQEDTTTTEDATTTSEDTTTIEDDTTTSEDTTTIADDTTVTTDETSESLDTTANTSNTTPQSSPGFLDSIDSMWLWVILGVGGIVLIGSLIGIVSLSRKEKQTEEKVQTISETSTPVEPPIQPIQQVTTSSIEEAPAPMEQSVPQEVPSIKKTLGDISSYQAPEVNGRIVSNIAPEADADKDLADLNVMGSPQTIKPQISTIETVTIKPKDVNQEAPIINPTTELNNSMNLGVDQIKQKEQSIPVTQEPVIDNETTNIMNSVPISPETTTPLPPNNTVTNPMKKPQNPPPIVEPQNSPSSKNDSTSTPQNQDKILKKENLFNQSLTQPVDTTGL